MRTQTSADDGTFSVDFTVHQEITPGSGGTSTDCAQQGVQCYVVVADDPIANAGYSPISFGGTPTTAEPEPIPIPTEPPPTTAPEEPLPPDAVDIDTENEVPPPGPVRAAARADTAEKSSKGRGSGSHKVIGVSWDTSGCEDRITIRYSRSGSNEIAYVAKYVEPASADCARVPRVANRAHDRSRLRGQREREHPGAHLRDGDRRAEPRQRCPGRCVLAPRGGSISGRRSLGRRLLRDLTRVRPRRHRGVRRSWRSDVSRPRCGHREQALAARQDPAQPRRSR